MVHAVHAQVLPFEPLPLYIKCMSLAPSERNNTVSIQYSKPCVGLGGPFTTNISTTKKNTLYTICLCPNRSLLIGSCVATSVGSVQLVVLMSKLVLSIINWQF